MREEKKNSGNKHTRILMLVLHMVLGCQSQTQLGRTPPKPAILATQP